MANPYHDEEGKFTTQEGQGTAKKDLSTKVSLKEGADLEKLKSMLAAVKLKPQQPATPVVPAIDYAGVISGLAFECSPNMRKGIIDNYNLGNEEAKVIVGDFFNRTKLRIKTAKSGACYVTERSFIQLLSGRPVDSYIQICPGDVGANRGKYMKLWKPGSVLYHEVFHGIDTEYFDAILKKKTLSGGYILSSGKTMNDTFHSEIATKRYAFNQKLYNSVKEGYFKTIAENYCKLTGENEQEVLKTMKSGERLKNSDAFLSSKELSCQKWGDISDLCSYIYKNTNPPAGGLGHLTSYWNSRGEYQITKELFAEMGAAKSINDVEALEIFKQWLPETYQAFEEIYGKLGEIGKEYERKYGRR